MNETAARELKILVERAVRPVRATLARKRRMREELLSHLAGIFKEEAAKVGDEQAALRRAGERFGDPAQLSSQLQESVPRWDRLRAFVEQLGYQRGQSVWRLAARHLLLTLLIYGVATAVALPIMLAIEGRYHTGSVPGLHGADTVLAVALVMVLLSAALSLVFAVLLGKIGPVLAGRRWGRTGLAVLCGLVAPFAFCGVFAVPAALFVLMARQAMQQRRYQEEWARLDVGE